MTKAVLILPGTALIYVPLLIHWFGDGWPFVGSSGSAPQWVLAAILATPALVLAVKTVTLFVQVGQGTPAPWDPPTKFVVAGPYLYVRNPMLTSVIFLILAEAIALNSLALLAWAVMFYLLNTAFFIFVEEPGLEQRFGEAYRHYKSNVPRWIPRAKPYKVPNGS